MSHACLKSALFFFFAVAPILAAGADTQPEQALKFASGPNLGADYLIQFSVGLMVVLMAVVALAWLMRRLSRFQSSVGDSLQALGGISLGPRERIILVKVGDTQLLLGVAPGRVQTLHVLEHPLPSSAEKTTLVDRGVFRKRLASAIKGAELGRETSS